MRSMKHITVHAKAWALVKRQERKWGLVRAIKYLFLNTSVKQTLLLPVKLISQGFRNNFNSSILSLSGLYLFISQRKWKDDLQSLQWRGHDNKLCTMAGHDNKILQWRGHPSVFVFVPWPTSHNRQSMNWSKQKYFLFSWFQTKSIVTMEFTTPVGIALEFSEETTKDSQINLEYSIVSYNRWIAMG